jgi:hypothetical protein
MNESLAIILENVDITLVQHQCVVAVIVTDSCASQKKNPALLEGYIRDEGFLFCLWEQYIINIHSQQRHSTNP